jgi:hypothetical protein
VHLLGQGGELLGDRVNLLGELGVPLEQVALELRDLVAMGGRRTGG